MSEMNKIRENIVEFNILIYKLNKVKSNFEGVYSELLKKEVDRIGIDKTLSTSAFDQSICNFVEKCIYIEKDASITFVSLLDAYKAVCKQEGYRPVTSRVFGGEMRLALSWKFSHLGIWTNRNTGRLWYDIQLKNYYTEK